MSVDDRDLGPAERAVVALVGGVEGLDPERSARLEAALAVARQLDHNSTRQTASGGLATAALARELRAGLAELSERERDGEWADLVDRLVSDD